MHFKKCFENKTSLSTFANPPSNPTFGWMQKCNFNFPMESMAQKMDPCKKIYSEGEKKTRKVLVKK